MYTLCKSGGGMCRHQSTDIERDSSEVGPLCIHMISGRTQATPCRLTETPPPYSPLQYLEQRLAELQRFGVATPELSPGHDRPGAAEGPVQHTASSSGSRHEKLLQVAALSFSSRATLCLVRCHSKLQHRAKLFYSSERPPLKIPIHGNYHEAHPRTSGRACALQSPHFTSADIPIYVARRLFDNYRDDILPRFPCFNDDDLVTRFNKFYGGNTQCDGISPDPDAFVVPMVLAISSLSSKSHDFRKVAALSESLYSDAMRHADEMLQTSSIPSLQCIILLIQLALLLPYTVNLWYLSGESMRMAVSLGLHQDPAVDRIDDSDPVRADMRRRMFWVVSISFHHCLLDADTDSNLTRLLGLST